jgi:hypothetical protein
MRSSSVIERLALIQWFVFVGHNNLNRRGAEAQRGREGRESLLAFVLTLRLCVSAVHNEKEFFTGILAESCLKLFTSLLTP